MKNILLLPFSIKCNTTTQVMKHDWYKKFAFLLICIDVLYVFADFNGNTLVLCICQSDDNDQALCRRPAARCTNNTFPPFEKRLLPQSLLLSESLLLLFHIWLQTRRTVFLGNSSMKFGS